jgi:molybdopterin biosynthesis enzyme
LLASDGEGERQVIAPVTAGEQSEIIVKSGTVARITTGAAVPEGSDAVVQVEDTELIESSDDVILNFVQVCMV